MLRLTVHKRLACVTNKWRSGRNQNLAPLPGRCAAYYDLYFIFCWNIYPYMYNIYTLSFNSRAVRANLLQLIIHKWLTCVVNLTQAWEVVITYIILFHKQYKIQKHFSYAHNLPSLISPSVTTFGCWLFWKQFGRRYKPRFLFKGRKRAVC